MLREGKAIGSIHIRRREVRPFSVRQIKLLETFADQAVIAIENVRLFQELKESLEQQTATSEILGVIASSPTDIQPVLDTVAKNAARLCEAADAQIRLVEGDGTRLVASFGPLPAPEFRPVSPRNPSGRAILTRETLHIDDLQEVKTEFPDAEGLRRGLRTFLSEPMLREGTAIGVINIRRMEVRPFSERHIKLLKTFASQAVIAIENVRLFKELQERNAELREALEQQTATSEILEVIATSPNDLTPVLESVAKNAASLCEGISAQVYRTEGDVLRLAANYGELPAGDWRPISRGTVAGRAVIERRTIHADDPVQSAADFTDSRTASSQARLATPLLRDGIAIGVIGIRRIDVKPFTDSQIKLVETFARQAVIAIENVRLFQELKESLEQRTATSEILGVIASSPTDIQPVLNTVAETAARLCEAIDVMVLRVDGDVLHLVAHHGPIPAGDVSLHRGTVGGRTVIERRVFHIKDLQAEIDEFPEGSALARERGHRTTLAFPSSEKMSRSATYRFVGTKSVPSLNSRSSFSKPLPIKP